ncbi:MAG: translation initiation factor IF-2 [Candidatus Omnitrophota bacterium]
MATKTTKPAKPAKPVKKPARPAKPAKPVKAEKALKTKKPIPLAAAKEIKLSDLAKQLKTTSKELIGKLSEMGIGISSDKNPLDEITIRKIKKALARKETPPRIEAKVEIKPEVKKKPEALQLIKEKAAPKIQKPAEEKRPETVLVQPPEEKPQPALAAQKVLQIKFPLTIKDLALKMFVGPSTLIKTLMEMGIMATINQLIDEDVAKKSGEKLGYAIEALKSVEEKVVAVYEEQDLSKLVHRAPVVTFMGHVDHGKTSLLDYIRKSKITEYEKGGITQHIGAYRVELARGAITFLDTPGHEAFTAMRARGATATDIIILVVAADDGIKPQTIEAISHARAAQVPIVVAINKIDKPNIDIDRVKKQLSEYDLLAEDWGGKTITVGVSAKTGAGIDTLLDMLLLEAEMLELKADPTKPAKGVIIEGKLSKGGGPIATVLVQSGTLQAGDIIVCGQYCGKVRALIDDRIHKTKKATPSMPVEILGLNGVPEAGDTFYVIDSEKRAREICESHARKIKEAQTSPGVVKISLEDLYDKIKKGEVKELRIILKADVQGSLEALKDSLLKIDTKEIRLNIMLAGVGEVKESDVMLAAASNAIIIGLHTTKTTEANEIAAKEGVDIKLYGIIYEAISDIKAALEGLLEPKLKEEFKGRALVRQVFNLTKYGIIAGCYVQKGTIKRTNNCRLIRNGQEVFKGKLSSLKRFKDDVKEMGEGFECGIGLEGFKDIQAGDIIEAFEILKIARKL